ncbi:N-acetylmuramoyl-L-alanine amidase family protein, partial [Chelativorans composti]
DAGTKDEDKRFTVAIDPGHGGIDGGARGHSGTQEKAITLAFALELRKALEESGKYRVVLTRDRDVFLRLDERVRIAREQGANLLISIHADAIRLKDFRGSTVYTLSEKASDAEAAATAARENLSDELAGIEAEEIRNDVADILADLMRRETHVFSIQFARTLVNEISDTVQLVNNPLRSAGFRVLRAHDVPSVLLELGYLSNAEDEKQLRDPEWRARAARGIVRAVDLFAEARARAGG